MLKKYIHILFASPFSHKPRGALPRLLLNFGLRSISAPILTAVVDSPYSKHARQRLPRSHRVFYFTRTANFGFCKICAMLASIQCSSLRTRSNPEFPSMSPSAQTTSNASAVFRPETDVRTNHFQQHITTKISDRCSFSLHSVYQRRLRWRGDGTRCGHFFRFCDLCWHLGG
jgi:hypothetical protein